MPQTIRYIAVHHSGAIGANRLTSSAHLTPADISRAHKDRWNFPSEVMKAPDGKPWYGGYNVVYDPKTRTFTQFRALGEETAAQVGYNFNTFSLCIIGNFSKGVDPMNRQIETDVVAFLYDLINGNKRRLAVVKGTKLELATARVNPHRFYGQTECYGYSLSDEHFRGILMRYKPGKPDLLTDIPGELMTIEPGTLTLSERRKLERLLLQLQALIEKVKRRLGAAVGLAPNLNYGYVWRECSGRIDIS